MLKMTSASNNESGKSFAQRLDFYWQFIAVYSVVLLIYSFMRGTIEHGSITFKFKEPLALLLIFFILVTGIAVLVNWYKKRTIIIGKDFIIFKNRFREKQFGLIDIKKIIFTKRKFDQKREGFRIIRIYLKSRIRPIKIRPTAYWDDKELVSELYRLKKLQRK